MRIVQILPIFALLGLVSGCAHPEWSARHSRRYYGMVDPDQTLERRLRFELDSRPDLATTSPHVLISVQNGTVTLSGAVPSERTRQEIDAIVRNTSGVAMVNDQLQPPYAPTGSYGRPARIYASPEREP
jgi:BON domain-containing protein